MMTSQFVVDFERPLCDERFQRDSLHAGAN